MAELTPTAPPRVKVLLVDDEPELLRGTSRLLGQAGYDVATAGDGVTAANLISRGGFDVVLSDISMPDMTGLELLAIARDLDLDVPIIMVTGAPTVKTAIEALPEVVYSTKPFVAADKKPPGVLAELRRISLELWAELADIQPEASTESGK